eukprot:scaffold5383_cov152-Skeletonema_dohrnii-CCMP3373.AAC.6
MDSDDDSDRFDNYNEDDEDLWLFDLQRIRENDPCKTELYWKGAFDLFGEHNYVQNITDEDWEQIGHAISSNTHLASVRLDDGALNDQNMAFLFRGLTRSRSIKTTSLYANDFSVDGVRSMVPFLRNANNLRYLNVSCSNIQSEGFNMLFRALRDSPICSLVCKGCDIELIEIDNNYIPNNLKCLDLISNNINADGCRELAKLLRGKDATLTTLWLSDNKIDDEGVGILVDALQNNTSLTALSLSENDGISKQGPTTLLKLVNNISSIKATLRSNHTLKNIFLSKLDAEEECGAHIGHALAINTKYKDDLETAGREKVIQTQLHSARRAKLADLQGVNHSVYSEINPLHLPEVLSLVGRHHGHGELYVALKSSIAGVISTVNRKEFIRQQRDYHLAKAEQLNAELAAIEAAEGDTVHVGNESHSNKRRRK